MSRALFVSDIHITSAEDPKARLFLRLLERCLNTNISQLFLVGDIFDFWIADRGYLIQAYAPIVEKIRELQAKGVAIHYFEGNHDLDLRPFWQHSLGVEVHSEPAYFTIGKCRVRVEHGDQMDRRDRGYLFLRWLLRTPPLVFMGRHLPEKTVRWIGRRASTSSREYTSHVKVAADNEVRETLRQHARQVFDEGEFAILIAGHVHVIEDSVQEVQGNHVRCVNLGTWLKEPMVFDLDENGTADLRSLNSLIG